MKKLIIAASLVAASFAANANPFCEEVSLLAKGIMTARQNGVPMPELMKRLNSVEAGDKFKDAVLSMAVEAYESPRYSTMDMKQKSVTEYTNTWYVACVKS